MFWPNCGKELNENSKFCIHCGFEISANNDEIYSHSYYKDSYKKKPANKKIKEDLDQINQQLNELIKEEKIYY